MFLVAQADDRRFAEAHYKAALALQFRNSPDEALVHARAAVRVFRARIARLQGIAAGNAPAVTVDPAPAPASAAAPAAGVGGSAAAGVLPAAQDADGGAGAEGGRGQEGGAPGGAEAALTAPREGGGGAADPGLAAKVQSHQGCCSILHRMQVSSVCFSR